MMSTLSRAVVVPTEALAANRSIRFWRRSETREIPSPPVSVCGTSRPAEARIAPPPRFSTTVVPIGLSIVPPIVIVALLEALVALDQSTRLGEIGPYEVERDRDVALVGASRRISGRCVVSLGSP